MTENKGPWSRNEEVTLIDLTEDIDEEMKERYRGADAEKLREQAHKALEEYDYEAARNLLKTAVWLSDGETQSVCELARFLVEDYAMFEEAIGFLTAKDCKLDGLGKELLANALFISGRKDDALEAYLALSKEGLGTAETFKRQGQLLMETEQFAEALVSFERALKLNPADTSVEKLKTEAAGKASARFDDLLKAAGDALDKGDLDESLKILDNIGDDGWRPPRYYRLRKELERRGAEAEVEALRKKACDLALQEEIAPAVSLFERILERRPDDTEAKERLDELRPQLQRRTPSGVAHSNTCWMRGDCFRPSCTRWRKTIRSGNSFTSTSNSPGRLPRPRRSTHC